jgi:hypothetical protein
MNATLAASRPTLLPPRALSRARQHRDADYQANVAIIRCGPNRGVAGMQILGALGTQSGEHFIPFEVQEIPSMLGRDFGYAGMLAVLERMRKLGIRRVLIHSDDVALVDELDHRAEPHRELTLPYITLGCKLNEFVRARVLAAPADRLAALREKTAALAGSFFQEVA